MIPRRTLLGGRPIQSIRPHRFPTCVGRDIPHGARSLSTRQIPSVSAKIHGIQHHSSFQASSNQARIGGHQLLRQYPSISRPQIRYASTTPAAAAAPASITTSSPLTSTPPPPETLASTEPFTAPTFTDFDGSSLLNLKEEIGYLHNLGLDFGYGPTSLMQYVVEHLHIWGGLPWWGSIIGAAVIIRVVLFKPSLDAAETSAKLARLQDIPEYAEAMGSAKDLTSSGATKSLDGMAQLAKANATRKRIMQQHDVQMWKSFLPLLQAPLAFGMFRLTRAMADLPVPGLETGGTLWFQDLTVADPFIILPAISSLLLFASIRLSAPYASPQQRTIMKPLPYVIGPITILATMNFSSAVTVFFATTAILQYLQTWLWLQRPVRRVFGLPPRQTHEELQALKAATKGSPLPTRPDIQWQAPRTISTTARPATGSAKSTTSGSSAESPRFKSSNSTSSTITSMRTKVVDSLTSNDAAKGVFESLDGVKSWFAKRRAVADREAQDGKARQYAEKKRLQEEARRAERKEMFRQQALRRGQR